MHPLVGRTLGSYRIDAPLGKGGMGEVFRGYQPALDRPVAIKVLYADLLADPSMEARFRQEAQAAARLRHPNIVQVYDFGEADGIFYMVMELIEGRTLRDLLRRLQTTGRLMPLDEACAVVGQLASALDYAHARGVLHRDIKPDNILLANHDLPLSVDHRPSSGGQRVVLTDFGLARLAGSSSLTRSGHIAGTPFYMAPEQCEGRAVDARADVYALGVVLYELLTGRVPFTADTPPTVIYQHIHVPPPRPRDLRPDLPPAVEDVVMLALAKRPEDRYAAAGALARDLEHALRVAPSDAFIPTTLLPPGAVPPAVPAAPATPPTATPAARPSDLLQPWAPIPIAARGRYGTLQVALAGGDQRAVPLHAPVLTIGRSAENDLQLEGSRVSRQHARIICSPDGCQVEDLGSTNGTLVGDERLLPHYPRPLVPGDVLAIGGHRLRYLPASSHDEPTVHVPQGRSAPEANGARSGAPADPVVVAALDGSTLGAPPGGTASATLTVQNRGQLVEDLRIVVEGLPAGWWSATPSALAVWPGGQERATLTFAPPRDGSATAGRYRFTVRVVSQGDPQRSAAAHGVLEVLPVRQLRADLRPRRVSTRGAGRYRLTLANDGNAAVTLALHGSDDEEALRFKMPTTIALAPGEEKTLKIRVGRRRGRLFGREGRYAFTIAAADPTTPRAGDSSLAQVGGELITRGLVPAWLTALVLLLTLLAGVAGTVYALMDDLLPPAWAAEVRRFVATLPAPGPIFLPWQPADVITAEVEAPLGLRLRTGPGIAYPAIGQFVHQTPLTLLEQHDAWFHVHGPQGEDGWVAGRFLSHFSAPQERVPQAASIPPVPPLGFEVVGVRVGTADGQRLRVVVDLRQLTAASAAAGLFEAPDPGPTEGEVQLYIRARGSAGLAPQYLTDAARALGDVALTPAQGRDGLVVRIVPKQQLLLRAPFLTPDPPPRVVIDLCAAADCPDVP